MLGADLAAPYSARGVSLVCVLRGSGARLQLQALRHGAGSGTDGIGGGASALSSPGGGAGDCEGGPGLPSMAPLAVPRPPPRLSLRLSWRALGPLLLVGGGAAQWGPFQAGLLFALLGYLACAVARDLAADPVLAADAAAGGAGLAEPLERVASAGASLLALGAPLMAAGLALHAVAAK